MNITEILTSFFQTGPWVIVKLFLLPLFVLYAVFAFVLLRQADLMGKTVEVESEVILETILWIHFIAAIVVIVLAFLFL